MTVVVEVTVTSTKSSVSLLDVASGRRLVMVKLPRIAPEGDVIVSSHMSWSW